MVRQKPAAFMSYARADDIRGRLTDFRENLSAEVRVQTGVTFTIFQDRNDIHWGEQWKKRIEGSLEAVTFLIPIITPSFFISKACRGELERFLAWEQKVKRDDLILPVYYVDCPLLNDEEKCADDDLALVIAGCHYADWRDLRFEPFTSPQVCKRLETMAIQIRDALERIQPRPKTKAKGSAVVTKQRMAREALSSQKEASEIARASTELKRGPSAKTEPPTRVVDPLHRGDHTTVTAAIKAANPGDRIIIRPGLYEEGLTIDKPLEIIGEGKCDEIVIQAKGNNVVKFQTTMGRIMNVTLRQMGGEKFGVDIVQGRLELEDCDITSQGLSCVAIHEGADPRLRRNRIHDGRQGGVYIFEEGLGTLEDNDIFGNAFSGVAISKGGNPMVRRNRIHDGRQGGVYIFEEGLGMLEDNDIFGNAFSGVAISKGGNPMMRRNRIHDGRQSGVYVYEQGQGTIEDNDIFGNDTVGVEIREGGNPAVRRNQIHKNGYEAVWVYNAGGGTIEDNDLRDNARGAWDVSEDSLPNLIRARNKE